MPEKVFRIDPSAVREALLTNSDLLVRVHGPSHQFHIVTVIPKRGPVTAAGEAARSAA